MGPKGNKTKAKAGANEAKGPWRPFVSVCTPTFNRRPFVHTMLTCFRNQTYPKDRMEWIIVDDGTDPIEDVLKEATDLWGTTIKYFRVEEKMPLGKKRNFMHTKGKGSIFVYMDDDDYYPPERVAHAVETLQGNKQALCAGASELYIYFKHISKMYQAGPYGPNHATAGTFAFKARLLDETRYEEHAALAEERAFLKDYTIPFVQLDAAKTILVFSHHHNTFDKRRLLNNPHPQYFKPSDRTVDEFIRRADEAPLKQFFLQDIDALLEAYAPGAPAMKPDVLEQTKEIEKKRALMQQQHEQQQQQQQNAGFIEAQNEKGEVSRLSPNEVVALLQQYHTQVVTLKQQVLTLQQLLFQATQGATQEATQGATHQTVSKEGQDEVLSTTIDL
jgi:hypothetical protein